MEQASFNIDPFFLSRIADGDEQAFFELFTVFSPRLRPFVRNITRSEADAEEVIQETFVRVWLARDSITGVQDLAKWLFTIASRESIRYMRRQLAHERKLAESARSAEKTSAISPLDYSMVAELRRIVQEVIREMPPQRRLIYQLSRDEGLKPAAIAEKLSLSTGTVKNVLSRALKEIRDKLEAAGIPLTLFIFHLLKII